MVNQNKKRFGDKGEDIAAHYLIDNGYTILQRNFRAGRLGEIDIIARESEFLCFVEVKARSNVDFGMPSESVNKKKQQKLLRLAYIYLSMTNLSDSNVRFDIVEVIRNADTDYTINLIKNAF